MGPEVALRERKGSSGFTGLGEQGGRGSKVGGEHQRDRQPKRQSREMGDVGVGVGNTQGMGGKIGVQARHGGVRHKQREARHTWKR